MIPVQPQPEPNDFDLKVRQPGKKFLQQVPQPTSNDWKKASYWREVLKDLYSSYSGICAYSAQWIPRTEGSYTVDHFVPKSIDVDLAYEWRNFWLACSRMNSRKSTYVDILDPFLIQSGWFTLSFPALVVKANADLDRSSQKKIEITIARLKLNQPEECEGRLDWLVPYCQKTYPFFHLKEKAPFIAIELERQDLVEINKIAYIMRGRIFAS